MGSHPKRVCPLTKRCLCWQHRHRFFYRESFTRQHGFIDEKIFGFLNQTVAGDDISGAQDDDISGHNLFDWNFFGASITKHHSFDLHDGQQLLHCVGGTALLPKPEQPADEDNDKNNKSLNRIL